MRIEVLVGSEDPVIFPIKTSKITIGSAETCDIRLDASGISRKHLMISVEGDQYFVSDQGSTNGSFINEERLVPGRRVEFTSFFPVRLGDNVLVSLLSDEDGFEDFGQILNKEEKSSPAISLPKQNDSTTVINIKDLQNQKKVQSLLLERDHKREVRKKQKAPPPLPKKKKTNYAAIFGISLVAVAAYYNFFVMAPKNEEPVAEIGQVVKSQDTAVPKVETSKVAVVPKEELVPKENFQSFFTSLKCLTDAEKVFCDSIQGSVLPDYGALQVGLTVHVLIDEQEYMKEALSYVKKPTVMEGPDYDDYVQNLREIMLYIMVMKYFPELDKEKFKDFTLNFAFFDNTNKEQGPGFVATVYAEELIKIKPSLNVEQLYYFRRIGRGAIQNFTQAFQIY